MGPGILRGAGGDENLKSNFIWPYLPLQSLAYKDVLKSTIAHLKCIWYI